MGTKIEQIKNYLKTLELGLSDLLLAIAFIFSVPFFAFAWKFMVTPNPADVFFKIWMMIVCFSIAAISYIGYFILEAKKGNLKNNAFLWIFLFLTILGLVAVLVQPTTVTNVIECKHVNSHSTDMFPGVQVGDMVAVSYTISPSHRLFFAFATLLIHSIYFVLLTLLPKRMKDFNFFIFSGICVLAFVLVITGYSYIGEAHKYPVIFNDLITGNFNAISDDGVISLLTHRVPYGVCLFLGFLYAFLLHALTKKWYWFIPAAYCYINMFFTWTKTALALGALFIAVYVVLMLIKTFKDHKKRNTIISIVLGSIVGVAALAALISVITQGKFLPIVYKVFDSMLNKRTITSRTYIWGNINTLLSNGWWLIGRGFGTYNSMLFPMNILNGDVVCPSHSTYYAVLGQGGIFTLIGFLGSIVYFGYVFVKSLKRCDKVMTIIMALPVFIFILYTFTEGINYLLVFFMFPLYLYYSLNSRDSVKA